MTIPKQGIKDMLSLIGKTKYFPPLRLEIKSLLVGVSKLINWCVGVLFLQRVHGI